MTTALIAEDEPLLAAELREELARCWPELTVVATVHDGHAAIRGLALHRPDVMFLDVQMPGVDGLEVARVAGPQAHIVFITAFDHYAVAAFDAGAVDYLLKPLDADRLGRAVERVKARLDHAPSDMSALLARIVQAREGDRLRFITTLKGREIEFIAIDEICYFKAGAKYVAVVTAKNEALITMPLRELLGRLDGDVFWQIHRGTIVNINAVKSVYRTLSGNLELRLKERSEMLRVGPSFTHLFQHM
jgi:DNA-binding LytR/AlgR family response regulator